MHNRTVAVQDSIQKFRFNFTVPVQNAVNDMNIINDYQKFSTAASPETHKETQKHGSIVVFRLSSKGMDRTLLPVSVLISSNWSGITVFQSMLKKENVITLYY